MIIKRTINGIDFNFELTPAEMYAAYFEQQEHFDIQDVMNYADMFDEDDFEEEVGCTYKEFCDMKEEIAYEMRRNMDKYDMDFSYARDEAVRDIVARYKEAVT